MGKPKPTLRRKVSGEEYTGPHTLLKTFNNGMTTEVTCSCGVKWYLTSLIGVEAIIAHHRRANGLE